MVNVPEHILGLTEYGQLRQKHESEFAADSWHVVEFSWTSDAWENKVRTKVVHIFEATALRISGRDYEVDIGIITALDRVELEAVLGLDAGWEIQQSTLDPTIYHRGVFRRGNSELQVVSASAPEMGMAAAASLTTKLIERWRPRYLAMVGIAAGVSGNFGDILIADRAWDYGSGKIRSSVGGRRTRFQPAPSQVPVPAGVKAMLSLFSTKNEVLHGIKSAWTGRNVKWNISARLGPFASGAAVVAARGTINRLRKDHRKLVGVEMEAYGVLLAASMSSSPRPQAFVVKSICDFGDRRKGDAYQRYAAFTSARFVYEFAFAHLAQRS